LATKSKSFRYGRHTKRAAFLLTCLFTGCLLVFAARILSIARSDVFSLSDLGNTAGYTTSQRFHFERYMLEYLLRELTESNLIPDEAAILRGESIQAERLYDSTLNLFNNSYSEISNLWALEHPDAVDTYPIPATALQEVFERHYATQISAIRDRLIQDDLRSFRNLIAELNSYTGLYYYYERGALHGSNYPGTAEELQASTPYSYTYYTATGTNILAFTTEYITAQNYHFWRDANAMRESLLALAIFGALALCAAAFAVSSAGRAPDGTFALRRMDWLHTELALGCIALISVLTLFLLSFFAYEFLYYSGFALYIGSALLGIAAAAAGLPFVLSLARRVKDGSVLRHTLIWGAAYGIFRFFKRIYLAQALTRRTVLTVAGLGALTMIPFAGFVTVPFAVWLSMRTLTRLTHLQEETLNEEMDHRFRAERMKTELISNVSHDLRTPLTSVITYIDLLRQEPTENENIRSYLEIIERKAARLKTLTDDLFEVSKAASGNIPVSLELVDLVSLTTQGLGELDEKIRGSGLDFRVRLPKEPLYVNADGRLLWRVIENLLSNVFKYALTASRVYLETRREDGEACFEVKNISAEPLNIPPSELTERFVRGDVARAGEGSGLGLAIAKSLTEAMGGRLEIVVDGDLFKAKVILKISS
jgi:signal transduction histidine kinase